MSLHIRIKDSTSFCGRPGLVGLTLRFAVSHPEWTIVLMDVFGCRTCVDVFTETFERMREDDVQLVWPK